MSVGVGFGVGRNVGYLVGLAVGTRVGGGFTVGCSVGSLVHVVSSLRPSRPLSAETGGTKNKRVAATNRRIDIGIVINEERKQ